MKPLVPFLTALLVMASGLVLHAQDTPRRTEPPPPPRRTEPPPPPPRRTEPPPPPRRTEPPPPPRRTEPPRQSLSRLIRKYSGILKRGIAEWLGTPYVWGGTKKKKGTDCSGFTRAL